MKAEVETILSTDSNTEPGVLGLGYFYSLLNQVIQGKDFTFNLQCFAHFGFCPDILRRMEIICTYMLLKTKNQIKMHFKWKKVSVFCKCFLHLDKVRKC